VTPGWYLADAMPAVPASTDRALADLPMRLRWYVAGRHDPTTRLGPGAFARAMWTPDGAATVLASWGDGTFAVRAWGPGAERGRSTVAAMAALDGRAALLPDVHPLVTESARRHRGLWAGASGDLYHALLPTIIEQRITSGAAKRQWRQLCERLGEPAPGPLALLLPPRPEVLAGRPPWWFHPFGIETKRARALVAVAEVADRLWDWARRPPAEVAGLLSLVRGVGPWTIGSVLGPACGDEDAVAVGDYHLPDLVAWNLAGEARADDARMLSLLEPYRGQRGRVIRLVALLGRHAPAFGPRQRILPMHRW
jgi:3-methyladenine DNA glycosylase/8-oxoguanine DNA glycosylase